MACTCPSGATVVSLIERRKYCSDGACTYNNTTYTREYWYEREIACKELGTSNIMRHTCYVKLAINLFYGIRGGGGNGLYLLFSNRGI